jgi:hypothetical protein
MEIRDMREVTGGSNLEGFRRLCSDPLCESLLNVLLQLANKLGLQKKLLNSFPLRLPLV